MVNENERLTLKIKEAAAMLGISKNLAYELARRGELPGVIKLGQKRLVVSKLAIERLLQGEDTRKGAGND
jgi:excisionase family DNA binding protein